MCVGKTACEMSLHVAFCGSPLFLGGFGGVLAFFVGFGVWGFFFLIRLFLLRTVNGFFLLRCACSGFEPSLLIAT